MSGSGGRSTLGSVALATVGGLVVVGATAASWVSREEVREVGGVELREVILRSGTEFAPQLYAVGVTAVLLGLALLVVGGRGRRPMGSVVALVGVLGLAMAGSGTLTAASVEGALTPGPAVAALGAAAVLTGGALATRRRATSPSLPARYSIDDEAATAGGGSGSAGAGDPEGEGTRLDEWALASAEPTEDQPTKDQPTVDQPTEEAATDVVPADRAARATMPANPDLR